MSSCRPQKQFKEQSRLFNIIVNLKLIMLRMLNDAELLPTHCILIYYVLTTMLFISSRQRLARAFYTDTSLSSARSLRAPHGMGAESADTYA